MQAQTSGQCRFNRGRTFLCRLPHNADLIEWLNRFAAEQKISAGTLSVIGAVKKAKVAFYDQKEKTYREITIAENLEILSCVGNVSIREDKPFAHCHATFSNSRGETFGGHLIEGTLVFAAEAHFQEVLGPKLLREFDQVTGLTLWKQS